METKKSKSADLEPRRPIFFEIGMVLALVLTLVAFEWKTTKTRLTPFETENTWVEDDMIPVTFPEKIQKPLPEKQIVKTKIDIVKNTTVTRDISSLFDQPDPEAPLIAIIPEPEKEMDEIIPTWAVSENAQFPGGENALMAFLMRNAKFPKEAIEVGISGRVYVEFIVNKDGKVSDIKIFRSIHPLLDMAALKAVQMLPDWKPAMQGIKPVRVKMTVPINFELK